MADNITALGNVGTGTDVLATDEIGGVHFPRSKLVIGADGVNGGDVSPANPLPVTATDLATLAAATRLEDSPASDGDRGIVVLAMRRDADTTTVGADGDYTVLKTDEAGRLKVAAQPGNYALVTGLITANAQTAFIDCSRGSNIIAHMVATSLVGHNVTFQGSIDSSNGTDGAWFAVQAVRTNANTIELATGVLTTTPAYGWELSVNGLKYLRVRATAHTSGTALWKFQQAPYATEPVPAAQISGTQPVSGSVTVSGTATITPATPTVTNAMINSAASTNGTVIKATAGTVYSVVASNTNAAVRYLKLYNSATVTVGTTVPVLTIPIPAGAVMSVPLGSLGQRFGTGICIGITTGAADNDTGAVAAAEIKVLVSYL